MMSRQILDSMSTRNLDQKNKLARFALIAVWLGGAIAINATIIRYAMTGYFPTETLVMAIIALLISIPVYRERQVIVDILRSRKV